MLSHIEIVVVIALNFAERRREKKKKMCVSAIYIYIQEFFNVIVCSLAELKLKKKYCAPLDNFFQGSKKLIQIRDLIIFCVSYGLLQMRKSGIRGTYHDAQVM